MPKKVIVSKEPSSNIISDEKIFGDFIKYKRTSLGLSLEETAGLCNVNYLTLKKLESGNVGTRLSTALKISKMLGLKTFVK
ncbi:MAG: helix-turn-helix transcriptional regulator [Campylobacteraceae bacterium]|nr:helix-turn-helix transcriptional regulator [Campylobacteraceae bacterium]